MFEIEKGTYIDIKYICMMKTEASAHIIKVATGETFIVSPRVFGEILKIKKFIDIARTEMAY